MKADGKDKNVVHNRKNGTGGDRSSLIYAIRSEDKVYPFAGHDVIEPDMNITVTRIDKKVSENAYTVPFAIVKKEDPDLAKGKEKLVQDGKEGTVDQNSKKCLQDGVLVSQVDGQETDPNGSC